MKKLVNASAVVEIKLRVTLGSAWGQDCKLDQVFDQAAREAVNKIRCALSDSTVARQITIIDNPKVKTVITEEQ